MSLQFALYESAVIRSLPSDTLATSGPVCVRVAFISPVLALACLYAMCPCGPQPQNKNVTDWLTQPRWQRVTVLWIQFSGLSSPLHGPCSDEA